jgi:hypothetical protein
VSDSRQIPELRSHFGKKAGLCGHTYAHHRWTSAHSLMREAPESGERAIFSCFLDLMQGKFIYICINIRTHTIKNIHHEHFE